MASFNDLRHRLYTQARQVASVGLVLGLFGCGAADQGMVDMGADLAPPAMAANHNIHVTVALKEDAQGVGIFAQNGALVHIPRGMIVDKKAIWAILKGGDQAANGKMLEFGTTKMDDQLGIDFTTEHGYPDGPWELALVILVASPSPLVAPQPGDLASFDLTPPPAGQPPVTGTSVRVTIKGADAQVMLSNLQFIKL